MNGLLVPLKDPSALANALKGLIGDPQLRIQYGRAGRARAEQEFGIERVQAETLEVYRVLANS